MKYSILSLMVLAGAYATANNGVEAPPEAISYQEAALLDVDTNLPQNWQISSPMSNTVCHIKADIETAATIILPSECSKIIPQLAGTITVKPSANGGYTFISAANEKIAEFGDAELSGYEGLYPAHTPMVLEPQPETDNS